MVNYGTKPVKHNLNTLPKWAREFIITGETKKMGNINALPQWARDQVVERRKRNANDKAAEKEYLKEYCKGCKSRGKCTPKQRAMCDNMRDIPPC